MVNGSEDGDLLDNDKDCATNRSEDLAHDEVSDREAGAAEVDHQTLGENVDGHSNVEQPLEVSRLGNGKADDEEEDARDHVEGVADVSGMGHADIVDDLEEGGEVVGPAVVGDLVGSAEETGADDRAVAQHLEVQHGPGS